MRAETLSSESGKSKQRWHSEWLFDLIRKDHFSFHTGGCPQSASDRSGRDRGRQRVGSAGTDHSPAQGLSVTAGTEILRSSRCETAGHSKTTLT